MIWFKEVDALSLENIGQNTMSSHLGITILEIGPNFIKAKMPVDERTKQPYGILHGGASVALAETIGSYGSHLVIDSQKFQSVGLEINANHIKKVSEGFVYGTAKPIHLGKSTHVWSIEIKDENEKLICICRLTVAIILKRD
ncbi:MAG TPA: hotdog fold thioesterase [Bacteroidia bacterium]|nr:hotdog fold thioesterase [Bacteroidia bacterium]